MSFTEISKGQFGETKAINSIRVASYQSGSGKVCISSDILEQVGSPMFFKIAVGEGKHSGFLALIPTRTKSKNSYSIHRAQGHLTISSKKTGLPMSLFGSTKVPHEITDDGIVIDIRGIGQRALQAAE